MDRILTATLAISRVASLNRDSLLDIFLFLYPEGIKRAHQRIKVMRQLREACRDRMFIIPSGRIHRNTRGQELAIMADDRNIIDTYHCFDCINPQLLEFRYGVSRAAAIPDNLQDAPRCSGLYQLGCANCERLITTPGGKYDDCIAHLLRQRMFESSLSRSMSICA